MTRRSSARALAFGVLLAAAVTGCSSEGTDHADEASGAGAGGTRAADVGTCHADATPVKLSGDGFPDDWPFPERSVVFHEEHRGDAGVIVTAVSPSDFTQVLDFMNEDVVDAGFVIESGETEEDDAEAEWEGNGYRGRWAIRESAQCPGETVIQVVAGQE